jgi:hypothetical protein
VSPETDSLTKKIVKPHPDVVPWDELREVMRNLVKCSKRKAILLDTFKKYHFHVQSNPNVCGCGKLPCAQLDAIDIVERQ